jgi:hypothetical protein
MLVPSTPRWDIRLNAICRIRRLVAEPSLGAAAARGPPPVGDVAVESGSDEWESIVISTFFLRSQPVQVSLKSQVRPLVSAH